MALSHTPLDSDSLSPAARKALGAGGPMKMMAARGLAPLPRPGDLITVLYQLCLDSDSIVAAAAKKSAAELPEKILRPALQDAELDPRVLDFFAAQVGGRGEMVELVLLNRATADETVAGLASVVDERLVEIVSSNEQRMLRHPAIIGAMYMNRQARMSTVDRAVELAVRNELRVPGIPAWEEVVAGVLGTKAGHKATSSEVDEIFAKAAKKGMAEEKEAESEPEEIPISQMTIPMKIRLATLGNKFARSELIRDANKMVSTAAIKAPGVNENEAVKHAGNNALHEDVIAYIASRRDWVKMYACKLALAQNPKTPLQTAIRLVAHLRDKDLRTIAKSKSCPTAIAAQARKLVKLKARGGKE